MVANWLHDNGTATAAATGAGNQGFPVSGDGRTSQPGSGGRRKHPGVCFGRMLRAGTGGARLSLPPGGTADEGDSAVRHLSTAAKSSARCGTTCRTPGTTEAIRLRKLIIPGNLAKVFRNHSVITKYFISSTYATHPISEGDTGGSEDPAGSQRILPVAPARNGQWTHRRGGGR